MNSNERRIRVAIAGGGIAGLALAAGLVKKEHIDVHVYESVPGYKDVGAGLALHMNAIKAMTLIGPEVRQVYFDKALSQGDEHEEIATEVILGQGPHSGTLVAELGRAKGRKAVSRADLLDGLLQLLPKDHITFGKRLKQVSEKDGTVQLSFEDGTDVEADCLLSADGVHSVTRSFLLGPDHPATGPKNHDAWQVYRTLVPMDVARKHINEKWTRQVPIFMGPRGHVNCIPLNKGTRLSAGVAVRGAKLNNGTAPPLDPALYADYSEEARKIVELVAKDTSASWSAADHDHAPFYAKGNIAVIGDAAHCSLPYAGNGAAQALEDAAVLDHLFSNVKQVSHIAPALLAYDTVRRPRSQRVVDIARQFGRIYAYAENGMHEDPVRMKKFFAETAAFTNNADLQKQNDEAMEIMLASIDNANNGAVQA